MTKKPKQSAIRRAQHQLCLLRLAWLDTKIKGPVPK